MREISPYMKIKYVVIFLCVNVAAYVASSLFLSLLDSRLGPIKPHLPVRSVEAKRDPQTKLPLGHYRIVWEKNIFFTSGTEQAKVAPGSSASIRVDQLSLTTLNCTLVGTMVEEEGDGWAIIMDNDASQQEIVTIGSHIKEARVVRIFKDKVVLNLNGKDELLLMDMEERHQQASTAPPAASSSRGQVVTYNISRNLVQESLNNLATVMSQARVEPNIQGGKPEGFRISQIQSGSLLNSMGFRNGDVIKSVNGQEISTTEDAMRLYEAMKGSSFFQVGILRDNRPQTIQVRVR